MQELYHQKERENIRAELGLLLKYLPSVDFGCVYGSCLNHNNSSQTSMIDYILGVSDPEQWHSENLKMNPRHYASWMRFGGGRLITDFGLTIRVTFSYSGRQANIYQDCGVSAASAIVSSLPLPIRSQLERKLGESKMPVKFGQNKGQQAAQGMMKLVRQKVRFSSARQAVAGLLTVGVFGGARYLANKVQKAWKSWT